MQITEIAERLERMIGLNPESIGYGAIEQSIKKRMLLCPVTTLEAYDQLLAVSPSEWTKLIEEVVVPETWFIRDRGAFLALKNIAKALWFSKRGKPIRLASIPCSTGEEPYSMAMVLMEAGLAPEGLTIDAIDISARVIQKAKEATYSETAFRGGDASFRERYFDVSPEGFRLRERFRACVTFYQGNLLKPSAPFVNQSYDVIFCRNLMIYLKEKNRRQLLQEIKERLTPKGILFVGHAEAHLAVQAGFEPLPYKKAFAFKMAASRNGRSKRQTAPFSNREIAATRDGRKKSLRERKGTFESATRYASQAASQSKDLVSRNNKTGGRDLVKDNAVSQTPDILKEARLKEARLKEDKLKEARRLADRGLLEEAQHLCEAICQLDPAQVEALFLMAMILAAKGDRKAAANYFRKVLYLDPNHEEALLNRTSYLNQNGGVNQSNINKKTLETSLGNEGLRR